jgi:LacI family transcriptional regulator
MSADGNREPAMRQHLTQREIARHAGVSSATVSLVLRKSPLVARATRARVLDAAASLGYV